MLKTKFRTIQTSYPDELDTLLENEFNIDGPAEIVNFTVVLDPSKRDKLIYSVTIKQCSY